MKRILILSFAGLLMGLTACKKSSSSSNTTMNVKITDGPGNYDAVVLNVKEINVKTSGGDVTLNVGSRAFDILKFRNGRDTLIASQTIPSGTLQEVRLVLEPTGNYVRIGGVNYDLTTPSGQTSGVKLKVQEELLDGVAYTLLLDFDAAKSIVQTGNGKYILKPVIRAIPQAVSGAITGMVTPLASSPKIYAISGVDTVGTIIDATGKYYFNGMPEGSYKVNFETSAPYINKSITNVAVTKGTVTNMGTVSLN
nr:DUF4382 domain-containing protein [Pseudopedobacter sp.]